MPRFPLRSAPAALLVLALSSAGCTSTGDSEMDETTAMGVGFLGVAGVAAAAGEPEAAAAVLQGGSEAMLQRSAATGGPSAPTAKPVDLDDDDAPAAPRPLPPMRACNGQRDCYEAALEQYVAAGRGNSPEANQLRQQIRALESNTPTFR